MKENLRNDHSYPQFWMITIQEYDLTFGE